jgi:hypothetical protein
MYAKSDIKRIIDKMRKNLKTPQLYGIVNLRKPQISYIRGVPPYDKPK